MTPLLLFYLCACSKVEVALPSCENVEATLTGTFLNMKIRTLSNQVTITSDLGYFKTIDSHYFGCITMNTDPGETFTIEDNGVTCTIVADQIVR